MSRETPSVDALLADESFQRWVLDAHPEDAFVWERWLAESPERRFLVDEARQLLGLLQRPVPGESMPEVRAEALWARIEETRTASRMESRTAFPSEPPTGRRLGWYARVAAAVAAVLLAGAGTWYALRPDPRLDYVTAFGETRTVTLPDGSRVTLNANSRLTLDRTWTATAPREVWLEGEAYFSVTHQQNHQRFVVHSDRIDVEVLGTEFNVYNRHRDVQVVLEAGRVQLAPATASGSPSDTVVMKPGQLFEYRANGQRSLGPANTERFSAWKNNRLLLDHTSLAELVRLLRENYGLTVRVSNETLLRQTASGSMPLGNEDDLLLQISRLFSLKISKENRLVRIEKQ